MGLCIIVLPAISSLPCPNSFWHGAISTSLRTCIQIPAHSIYIRTCVQDCIYQDEEKVCVGEEVLWEVGI